MIKVQYGNFNIKIRDNQLNFILREDRVIRHYPGTNISSFASMGRRATEIGFTAIVHSESERLNIEQLLHDSAERSFTYGDRFYKRVVPDGEPEVSAMDVNRGVYLVTATLKALDPVPYDVDTEEALY